MPISRERVMQLIAYDPSTGEATWRVKKGRKAAGAKVGCIRPGGYVVVRVDREQYFLHRLAWLIVHGKWPSQYIDHIDGNPGNNAILNLRDVSQSQNMHNIHKPRKSASGITGVRWHKGKWVARLNIRGQEINLGRFSKLEDAADAVKVARAGVFLRAHC